MSDDRAWSINIKLCRETDSRWIADIPDLPGCLAYGATIELAKANALTLAARTLVDREKTRISSLYHPDEPPEWLRAATCIATHLPDG